MKRTSVPSPKAGRVTYTSRTSMVVRTALLVLVALVGGFIAGQAHQQYLYDAAVERAVQGLKQQGPAGELSALRVSWYYNGQEMPDLTQNPNCTLYRDPCPLDPPTKPTKQPPHCTPIADGNWDCGGYRDPTSI